MARLLLDRGADPNLRASCGSNENTPLEVAVCGESPKMVKLLLDRGADQNAPPGTPFSYFRQGDLLINVVEIAVESTTHFSWRNLTPGMRARERDRFKDNLKIIELLSDGARMDILLKALENAQIDEKWATDQDEEEIRNRKEIIDLLKKKIRSHGCCAGCVSPFHGFHHVRCRNYGNTDFA